MHPAPPIALSADYSFDPSWLVAALQAEHPDRAAVIAAAARCTRYISGTELYVHFVSPEKPNQPGSEWQIGDGVIVENSPYGEVVIDVLKDGRIGGIEFLDRVFHAAREGRLS